MTADPAGQFALRVAASPPWRVRVEEAGDAGFLRSLFLANAVLGAMLPPSLMEQQHAVQEATFRVQHPDAMRAVLLRGPQPVGRMIIDWSGRGAIHGVDLGVLATGGGRGGGLVLLKAWLAVADRLGRDSTLSVVATNPARRLYAHLGFHAVPDQPADAPVIAMLRPCRRG